MNEEPRPSIGCAVLGGLVIAIAIILALLIDVGVL